MAQMDDNLKPCFKRTVGNVLVLLALGPKLATLRRRTACFGRITMLPLPEG